MSSVATEPAQTPAQEFLPPAYAEPHIRRQLDDLLRQVEETVAPVWPLKDYVAVNPYAGIRRFLQTSPAHLAILVPAPEWLVIRRSHGRLLK